VVRTPLRRRYEASAALRALRNRLGSGTHNDAVLAYVDVGANLGRIDNAVLFYEDMITDVEGEKSHPATGELVVQVHSTQTGP